MSNSPSTETNQRVVAFSELRRIIAEHRGGKLFDDEAETLLDAASDMMLAEDGHQVQDAQEAFDAQMDRLEAGRWAEMIGSDAHPGTATKLRRAFAGCAPEQYPLAA
jgi:adenosylmethionine-8-amino-7-oxononanoate aminotransferase